MSMSGTLYLIPCSLGEQNETSHMQSWQPLAVRAQIQKLQYFVVENAKTARAFLKACEHPQALVSLQFIEIPKHETPDTASVIALLRKGINVGVLSEAGCPGVADPGAVFVAAAHLAQIPVKPLVGPSALLLALMASGMNGQGFAFHGYLPIPDKDRFNKLKILEQTSRNTGSTQLFIETPFRNQALLLTLLSGLAADTRLAIACDLTLPSEWICVKTIAQWRKEAPPDLHKRPAVFLLDARKI